MKVLVTGCAGYIGSLLSEALLKHGYSVIGIDNFLYKNQGSILHLLGNEKFQFVKKDVCDTKSIMSWLEISDVVCLTHGLVGMPICKKLPTLAWQCNTESVKNIVKCLSKEQKVLIPNTNSGYGSTDGITPCDESTPMNPISVYGQSKIEGEKYVLDHENSVSLRLATVFGVSPRMRSDLLINTLFTNLYFDKEIQLFDPHFMRNYVHIRDVVRGFLWAIPYQKGIFNFGNDQLNMSKLTLAEEICSFLNIEKTKINIDTSKSDEDKRNYVVSSNKIVQRGFKFDYSLINGFVELQSLCKMYENKTKILSMGNMCL